MADRSWCRPARCSGSTRWGPPRRAPFILCARSSDTPPGGLVGAPYLVKNNISLEGLNTAKCVFTGSAREAAAGFPANVNVVAALSLAGIGPDRTTIELWADPAVTRNCHSIEVDADSARFSLAIENIPSENPKTGRITALSVLAALRKLNAPLRVGT